MVTRRQVIKASGSLAALLSGLGLAGCTTTTTPTTTAPPTTATVLTTTTPIQGGTLKIGVPTMGKNVDTRVGSPTGGPPTWCSCLEPLFGRNETYTLEVEPLLATSMTTSDYKSYRIELREGVKFHNGSDCNADDVVALLEWIAGRLNNGYTSVYALYFGTISQTRKVDSHTIDFELAKARMGLDIASAQFYSYLVIPEEQMRSTASVTWPIGTGPYKITAITPGEYVKLEPFDEYWGIDDSAFLAGPAYLDTVEVFLYSDEQARLAALQTREIDVAILNDYPSVAVVNSMPNASLMEIDWYTRTTATYNNRSPPFDDIRFREAMSKGVNWTAICNTVWPGQSRCWDMCINTPWAYPGNAESIWPTYNFNTAKALIDQMIAEGKINRTLNLIKSPGRSGENVAELVKSDLDKLGVPSTVMVVESAALSAKLRTDIYPPTGYDMAFQMFYGSGGDEPFTFTDVMYSKAGYCVDGRHYGGIADPVIDIIAEEWMTPIPDSRRSQLSKDLQERCADRYWLQPLVFQHSRMGYNKVVQNLRPSHTFRVGPFPYTRVWKTTS